MAVITIQPISPQKEIQNKKAQNYFTINDAWLFWLYIFKISSDVYVRGSYKKTTVSRYILIVSCRNSFIIFPKFISKLQIRKTFLILVMEKIRNEKVWRITSESLCVLENIARHAKSMLLKLVAVMVKQVRISKI